MATPKVFISSTCYDLKYIRDNLRYFISTLGYEPILSEDGAVFFDPNNHTHDSCLTEIPNCQLFVLIIGGRHGGKFQGTEDSITNMEYREAIKNRIPVFTLVESGVLHDHHSYSNNKKNIEIDLKKFHFPSSDSIKIFEFIDEVRKASSNNALIPFRDFNDIESYLRKQWAGMMYKFLTETSAAQKVQNTLDTLKEMNEKIEFLTNKILNDVGQQKSKDAIFLYDYIYQSDFVKDFKGFTKDQEFNLQKFLISKSLDDFLEKMQILINPDMNLDIEKYFEKGYKSIKFVSEEKRLDNLRENFIILKKYITSYLSNSEIKIEDLYLN